MQRLRRRWLSSGIVGLLCVAKTARAQSLSIDGVREPGPGVTKPKQVVPPQSSSSSVTPPRAITTAVAYPSGQLGDHEVVLELDISKQGSVSAALVMRGDAPFGAAARAAAERWQFEPARRAGRAIAAKIRFLVRFVAPAAEARSPAAAVAPATDIAKLPPGSAELEIVVRGQREPLRHTLSHADVRDLPGAFGDPYRAIEALPGVVPIVSGLPYFYVRGAPPGNVGYFFDGIPVPYLYHFAAGPGVLQPAFIDHVDLYPGAYPARYGRFAGAIVAGEMAQPSSQAHAEASVRLIDSGAVLELPFASGRGSVMLGGRFSYTAAVLSLLVPDITLDYWDYQGRASYQIDAKNSIELLTFGAGDFLGDSETDTEAVSGRASPGDSSAPPSLRTVKQSHTVVDVDFHRLDLRFDHRLTDGNWRNAVFLGLDRTGGDDGRVTVKDRMIGLRSEYRQQLGPPILLRAGADALFESLAQNLNNRDSNPPTDAPISVGSTSEDAADFNFDRARRDFTSGVWADAVLALARDLEVTPGLRADLYVSGGHAVLAFDPRISVRFTLSKQLSVSHGLALVHQAPSFVVPVPGFKPALVGGLQSAVQHSGSLSYSLPAGFESSLALFQDAFFNLTDLISLAELESTTNQPVGDVRSTGHAYGVEFMLRRSLARAVGGFVSYTLSRSVRSSGQLEGPAATDRTHVLNVALSGNLGKNWRLGARWLFYSGIPSHVAYISAAQAPPRTPPFWRLDLKLQKRWYIKRPDAWWGMSFEVLNTTLNQEALTGDCNAFSCTYQKVGPVTVPSVGAECAF